MFIDPLERAKIDPTPAVNGGKRINYFLDKRGRFDLPCVRRFVPCFTDPLIDDVAKIVFLEVFGKPFDRIE